MGIADGPGDDVYQPDASEIQDDSGLLDVEDTLETEDVDDPLDRGWSPPEKPWGVERTGETAAEQHRGESLDERLAKELPDGPDLEQDGDGIGDAVDTDGEPVDSEVGAVRAGRLVAPDEGLRHDEEAVLAARDVGIDGAAASAEEAAVHVIDEE
ncbi:MULTISPECIES: DUF5709 domain-containing protein [Streptomyces]|uniref:DUF5709 domain-containing protein n=1 Tax=Streptomyces TaxID=1883 RepID=UPI00140CACEE|nr:MULTISPECIES: DUF5709 domain-containing protein [Streptomyces]MDH6228260.1 hypothetical protein [Streptomyces sp. MJP52]